MASVEMVPIENKFYWKSSIERYYQCTNKYWDVCVGRYEGLTDREIAVHKITGGEKMLDGNQEKDVYGATHTSVNPDVQRAQTAVEGSGDMQKLIPKEWEGKPDYKCEQLHSTPRAEVLEEAKQHITGDRNASYGPPTQDFKRTADMWTALLQLKLKPGERIRSQDVAWMMIMLKASRAQHSEKRDNYTDAAGYAGCGWECETETET